MKAFLLKYRSSLLLFAVMFLFGWGSAAVVAKWQSNRETEETMHIEAAVDNWGLGFGESGKELQPTGNATADELKQYDTYYIGSKEEKVIYLTFDCGIHGSFAGIVTYECASNVFEFNSSFFHIFIVSFEGIYLRCAGNVLQRCQFGYFL